MTRQLDVVADGYSQLSSPRWRDGTLWVLDGPTGRVLRTVAGGQLVEAFEVPEGSSALGWLPDGRMLVVSARERRILRREPSGDLVLHADLAAAGMQEEPHDIVVGPNGRAFVGEFRAEWMDLSVAATPSRLYRAQPDGEVLPVLENLQVPNGMVLFPDYTFVLAESRAGRLLAFDKGTDGTLGGRRIWALLDSAEPPAVPSGICADIDGNVWVADVQGRRVLHVRSGGEVLEQIDTGPYAMHGCMLGGDDGRTLYLCTDATLLGVRVDVPHGALP